MAEIKGASAVRQVAPRRALDPGVAVPTGITDAGRTTAAQAEALQNVGGQVSGFASGLLQAEQKVRDRKDALDRIKQKREAQARLQDLDRDFLLQQDPTDRAALQGRTQAVRELIDSHVTAHQQGGASASSLADLQNELTELEFSANDRMAVAGFETGQKLIQEQLSGDLNVLAGEVVQDKTKYLENLDRYLDTFEQLRPHMQVADEFKTRAAAVETFTLSALENYMASADFDGARQFLADPAILSTLSAEKQTQMINRINKADQAKKAAIFNTPAGLVRVGDKGAELVFGTPKAPNPVNFVKQGETPVVIDLNAPDAREQLASLPEGFVRAGLEAGSLEGLGAPTTATQTDLQTQRRQTEDVVTNLGAIIQHLEQNPDTVGALGFGAGILNRTLAQVNPKFFGENRAALEQLVNASRQMALRVVSDETRFSEGDRQRIEELFPSTGPFEAPERALLNARMLRMFFVRRNITASEELGVTPNIEITPIEIREAMRSGIMTRQDAKGAMELLFPEAMGAQ